jgi:RNA polymerase sigma-70 factor (ECF subfamily)
MTDRALLDRLREGDTAAFDALFRAWYAPLVRLAEGMLRDRAVAEEIVQDVLLELWRRRETLVLDGSPQAYLFQATRNRALNHIRHLRVRQQGEPQVIAEMSRSVAGDTQLIAEEIETALRSAINELPPRCREVFELSRMRGLRYAEIAETLGISVKTVEAQMGKALRTLRERLAPWLPQGHAL